MVHSTGPFLIGPSFICGFIAWTVWILYYSRLSRASGRSVMVQNALILFNERPSHPTRTRARLQTRKYHRTRTDLECRFWKLILTRLSAKLWWLWTIVYGVLKNLIETLKKFYYKNDIFVTDALKSFETLKHFKNRLFRKNVCTRRASYWPQVTNVVIFVHFWRNM